MHAFNSSQLRISNHLKRQYIHSHASRIKFGSLIARRTSCNLRIPSAFRLSNPNHRSFPTLVVPLSSSSLSISSERLNRLRRLRRLKRHRQSSLLPNLGRLFRVFLNLLQIHRFQHDDMIHIFIEPDPILL